MVNQLRSYASTFGRRMAGARALWRANGMKEEQMGKPIIAVVNSFTQFVPGHTHLHEIGQIVKHEIEKLGCFAAEFNTIAIDDGIAMGHDLVCFIPFLLAIRSLTLWNIWSMLTRRMPWYVSAIVTKLLLECSWRL